MAPRLGLLLVPRAFAIIILLFHHCGHVKSSFASDFHLEPYSSYDDMMYTSPSTLARYMAEQEYPSEDYMMAAGSYGYHPLSSPSSYPTEEMFEKHVPLGDRVSMRFEAMAPSMPRSIPRSMPRMPLKGDYFFAHEDSSSSDEESGPNAALRDSPVREPSDSRPRAREAYYGVDSQFEQASGGDKMMESPSKGGDDAEARQPPSEELQNDQEENHPADSNDAVSNVGYSPKTGRPFIKVMDDGHAREDFPADVMTPEEGAKKDAELDSPSYAADSTRGQRRAKGGYANDVFDIPDLESETTNRGRQSPFNEMDVGMRGPDTSPPSTPPSVRHTPQSAMSEDRSVNTARDSTDRRPTTKRPAPAYTPPPTTTVGLDQDSTRQVYTHIYNEARPPPRYDQEASTQAPTAQESTAEDKINFLLKQRKQRKMVLTSSGSTPSATVNRNRDSSKTADQASKGKQFGYGFPLGQVTAGSSPQPAATMLHDQKAAATVHGSGGHSRPRTLFHEQGFQGPFSYRFGFDTADPYNPQTRYEERDGNGHVRGSYSYLDPKGKLQVVHYEADPHSGFHAKGSFGEFPVKQKQ
ncbi:uncharacterized protein LOC135400813 [Ornithodoros turicata]|uniref:uncharacterized protein LOC135400813 n=1 Tax=Ornithodoros turicata TaxID=34597 RepID=UPI003138E6C5